MTSPTLESLLSHMPPVAEDDFTAQVMRRVTRYRTLRAVSLSVAWLSAVAGILLAVPLEWVTSLVQTSAPVSSPSWWNALLHGEATTASLSVQALSTPDAGLAGLLMGGLILALVAYTILTDAA